MEVIQEPLNDESIQKLLDYLPYFLENKKFEKEKHLLSIFELSNFEFHFPPGDKSKKR